MYHHGNVDRMLHAVQTSQTIYINNARQATFAPRYKLMTSNDMYTCIHGMNAIMDTRDIYRFSV